MPTELVQFNVREAASDGVGWFTVNGYVYVVCPECHARQCSLYQLVIDEDEDEETSMAVEDFTCASCDYEAQLVLTGLPEEP